MSAQDKSSDLSRKLLTLLLSIIVIAVMFAAIVLVWVASNGTISGQQGNASNSSGSPVVVGPGGAVLVNATTIDGITRTSLLRSVSLVHSTGAGAAWFQSNPDAALFMAQANYMDDNGLSRVWSLIFSSANGSLVASVDNGAAAVLSADDNGSGAVSPGTGAGILDSNFIVSNATGMKGIIVDATETPFMFVYSDNGSDGIDQLTYTDPADPGQSFVLSYDAQSGELIEA